MGKKTSPVLKASLARTSIVRFLRKTMYKDPLEPGYKYHIYNRGNNTETIFKEEANYTYFLYLWKKYVVPVIDTYCYNLLPNHFHFLIETLEKAHAAAITQSLSNCFNAYSKSINKAYTRNGSLFQERFGRKKITDDFYFTQVIFYIHSNAEKHGLVTNFQNYPHSSYQSLLSPKPTLLCRDRVFEWFGGRQEFIDFHQSNRELMLEYLKTLALKNL